MRDWFPLPMLSRYAVVALTAWTSRNCSESAPGTRPVFQVAPPSVVRSHVPSDPLTQTVCSSTGLTAMSSAFVPLSCSKRMIDCPVALLLGALAHAASATARPVTHERVHARALIP